MMTKEMLTKLSDEVGPNRSLLICCGAYRGDVTQFENLTVKKIPKEVLKKCEWGHDDYSLEIKNLPVRLEEDSTAKSAEHAMGGANRPTRRFGKAKTRDEGPTLFDFGGVK
jgi:adenine-specific DNA-methyltransferase